MGSGSEKNSHRPCWGTLHIFFFQTFRKWNKILCTVCSFSARIILNYPCFQVIGIKKKKYHLECQSTTDNKMIIRMFEYDTQITLDEGEIVKGSDICYGRKSFGI